MYHLLINIVCIANVVNETYISEKVEEERKNIILTMNMLFS